MMSLTVIVIIDATYPPVWLMCVTDGYVAILGTCENEYLSKKLKTTFTVSVSLKVHTVSDITTLDGTQIKTG